jgi:uncharacterized phage infection (PIP) family protein YhgE
MAGHCLELPSKIGVGFITGVKEYEPYTPSEIERAYMIRLLSFKCSKSFKLGFASLKAALRVLTICEVPVDSEWAEDVQTNTDKFDALWMKLKQWKQEIEDAEDEDDETEEKEEQEDDDDEDEQQMKLKEQHNDDDEDKEANDDDNEDKANDDDNEEDDFHECKSSGDKGKSYFIQLVVLVILNLIRILTFLSFRCLLYY